MDLGTIITGIVIILICIIPFVLMSINNNKKEKRLLHGLFNLAQKNNGKITRHDLWDNAMIGIDDTTNQIFFIRKVKDIETAKQVDLAEIQKCRVVENSRTISKKDSNHKVTDQIELVLTYHDKRNNETILEFYNANYDSFMLKGEFQLAEKWSSIFNDAVSAKTKQIT